MFEIKENDKCICFLKNELIGFYAYIEDEASILSDDVDLVYTVDLYFNIIDDFTWEFDNKENWEFYISKLKNILEENIQSNKQ